MKNQSQISVSDSFREQERKLNAASGAQLEQFRQFIAKNPYYTTLEDPRFITPLMAGFKLRPPQEDSALRFRVYFDNCALNATRSGIEIRMEDRSITGTEGWPYKQVIKIGQPGNAESHTLDRMEYTTKLKQSRPQLQTLKGESADYLKGVFNSRSLSKIQLYPLVSIASQRWKMLYHPDGNKDVQIELATDIGRGQTVDGFTWDIFQVEIEMKKGAPKCFGIEEAKFMEAMPFLVPEFRSKPSPGFDHLMPVLEKKKNRELIRHSMNNGIFQTLEFKN
ncbi:MAG: hypothetical protein ACK4NR_12345 [Micavibrio sp.]